MTLGRNYTDSPTPEQIIAARADAGHEHIKDAAAAIGVHWKTWQKWERGEQKMHHCFYDLYRLVTKLPLHLVAEALKRAP